MTHNASLTTGAIIPVIDDEQAVIALTALAQKNRLQIYRYLLEKEPDGAPAGQIAGDLALQPATLSFHLKTLKHAGLVENRRVSQSLIYRANIDAMSALMGYLTENCCHNHPEHCGIG